MKEMSNALLQFLSIQVYYLCLMPYGWRCIVRLIPYHLRIFRWFLPTDRDDLRQSRWPLNCSGQCSVSDRAGGIDPCPNLADWATEPNDLTHSPFYKYVGTLYP